MSVRRGLAAILSGFGTFSSVLPVGEKPRPSRAWPLKRAKTNKQRKERNKKERRMLAIIRAAVAAVRSGRKRKNRGEVVS